MKAQLEVILLLLFSRKLSEAMGVSPVCSLLHYVCLSDSKWPHLCQAWLPHSRTRRPTGPNYVCLACLGALKATEVDGFLAKI